jgi:hypothetical protein
MYQTLRLYQSPYCVMYSNQLFTPRCPKGRGLRGPFSSFCQIVDMSVPCYDTWVARHQDMS